MPSAASAWRPASSSRSCASAPHRSSAPCTTSSQSGRRRRGVAAMSVERGRRLGVEARCACRQGVAGNSVAARDATAPAGRFERGERAGFGRRRRRQGLEPVEVGVGAGERAGGLQQRHHARAGARRRHLPAGLVGDARAGALEQRANASDEDAIERDERDRPLAATEVVEHLRGRGPGLVLEAVADDVGRRLGGELSRERRERLVERHVGVDDERRRVAVAEQRERQPIGAAGLDRDPRRRAEREQPIGRRRVGRGRGPFDGDAGELLLEAGRAARRAVERVARGLPPRRPRRRRPATRRRVRARAPSPRHARPRARSRADRGASIRRPSARARAAASRQACRARRRSRSRHRPRSAARATRRACASSRSAASTCRVARRRVAQARAARRTAPAPRRRATRPRRAGPSPRTRRR